MKSLSSREKKKNRKAPSRKTVGLMPRRRCQTSRSPVPVASLSRALHAAPAPARARLAQARGSFGQSSSRGGRHVSHTTARSSRPAPVSSDHVQLSPGRAAAQQGAPLSAGSANCGRHHRGHAHSRQRPRGRPAARRDRRAMARRAPDQRGARAQRDRPRRRSRRAADSPWQRGQTP